MTRTTVLTFPWIAMTSVMLIYGMMAAIVYMADLSIPIVSRFIIIRQCWSTHYIQNEIIFFCAQARRTSRLSFCCFVDRFFNC